MSEEFVVSTTYEGNTISLVTHYDGKWHTNIIINNKKSAEITHKNPISSPEKVRDGHFSDRLTGAIENDAFKPRHVKKIINDLIDDASAHICDIEHLQTTYLNEQALRISELAEHKVDQKIEEANEIREKIKRYYDILKNKDGNNSVEEIEAAKIGLKSIMMPTFWEINQNGNVSLNKLNIAEYLNIAYNLVRFGTKTWRYDWDNAYYVFDPEDEILQQAIANIMDETGDAICKYNGNITSDKNQIIDHASFKRSVHVKPPFNQYSGLINAKNGVLQLDYENRKVTLLGKKPVYMFSYCVDTIYDPNADPGPIDKFLEEVVGPEQKEIIYQMAALAIRDTDIILEPSKVAYYFNGKPNTGKNAILRLLTSFIGQTNVATIPLHQIAEDKFVKSLLEGKLMNLDDEAPISLPMNESREIKSLTGGKIHTLNPKGVQQYQGVITALLVFAGNQFPRCYIPETDEAFWRRWDILRFNNVFTVNEKFAKTIFTQENLSGFFNKVIEKLFDINENGIKRLSTPKQVYEDWQYESSSVYKFIKDMMVETNLPQTHIKSMLHREYLNWCEVNHIPKENIRMQAEDFGKEIIGKCKADSVRSGNIPVYRMFRALKRQHFQTENNNIESCQPKSSVGADDWGQ
jgi:P4 family phage/plasmid primase-like protien